MSRSAARGTLHLMPVPIAPAARGAAGAPAARPGWSAEEIGAALPAPAILLVRRSRYFLAENARTARAFLKAAGHECALASLQIVEIGHAPADESLDAWLAPLLGTAERPPIDAVVLPEAGCPGIADPGASLVARAQQLDIRVEPWVGPSSILLALMGSGMNGQRFRFLGYLPQDRGELHARIAQVQTDARRGETQIFIETPYRNERLLEALLGQLDADLELCLAVELGSPASALRTLSVAQWRALAPAQRPALARRPTVFLLHGRAARGAARN